MSDSPNVEKLNIDDVDEEDDDEFVDESIANLPAATDADLLAAITEAMEVFNLFIDNKQDEATKRLDGKATKSIYHALGVGTLHFLRACISFAPADIAAAAETLKRSAGLCNRRRKKTGAMSKMVKKTNYNSHTEEEVHAELCYAECVLLRGLVTLIQDDNMMNIVKGGLRFRKSYRAYKTCEEILETRTFANEQLKKHFESGVYMGIGGYNLLLSSLPKRLLKLVEFVGFSGKRELGHQKLEDGRKLKDYARGQLCSLFIMAYHGYVSYFFGRGCTNLEYPAQVLAEWEVHHPTSALVKFAHGRQENLSGNLDKAIEWLDESLKVELDWKTFYHVPYIELAWCYGMKGNYKKSTEYIDILLKENHWTKCIYSYVKATGIFSMGDQATDAERKEMVALMGNVPNLRRRFSGKSNPVEKFFCRKADRFLAQGNSLVLPDVETWYVWNYFMLMKGKPALLEPILARIEATIAQVQTQKDSKFYVDNYCLALFLKGVCLRYLDRIPAAEECFKEVLQNHKKLKDDVYLISVSNMELGFIALDSKNYSQATTLLKTAKKEKNFWAEFRIHQGRVDLKALGKK